MKNPLTPAGIEPASFRFVAQHLNHCATPIIIIIIIIIIMWNLKTNVISVITGATETISESFRQYLSKIPEKRYIKDLQKTATLGTAHGAESTDVKYIQQGK